MKEPKKRIGLAPSTRKTCPSNADKSSGRRMSLNRSQYGGCSTGLQHPDRYLGRLRTISRLHVYLVCDQKPVKAALLHRCQYARLHQCGIARLCGKAERISAEQQGGAKVSLQIWTGC